MPDHDEYRQTPDLPGELHDLRAYHAYKAYVEAITRIEVGGIPDNPTGGNTPEGHDEAI